MSAGLDLDGEAGEEEGSKSEDDDDDDVRGDEAAPAPKLVRPEFKKTKQQRRKEAERRQQASGLDLVSRAFFDLWMVFFFQFDDQWMSISQTHSYCPWVCC